MNLRASPVGIALAVALLAGACGSDVATSSGPTSTTEAEQTPGAGDDNTGATPSSGPTSTTEAEQTPGADDDNTGATPNLPSAIAPILEDAPSPAGGTVKRLVVPGPQTSVLVVCDQDGFQPFLFTDQGDWVGCEFIAGSEAGPDSGRAEPIMSDVDSPAGGTVNQVTIPGPQASILVTCGADGFVPFLFNDQGTWVGCQTG